MDNSGVVQNVSGAIRKHLHKNFNVDVHHFVGQPVKDMVQHLAQAANPIFLGKDLTYGWHEYLGE